jgi:hypothetical protein
MSRGFRCKIRPVSVVIYIERVRGGNAQTVEEKKGPATKSAQ